MRKKRQPTITTANQRKKKHTHSLALTMKSKTQNEEGKERRRSTREFYTHSNVWLSMVFGCCLFSFFVIHIESATNGKQKEEERAREDAEKFGKIENPIYITVITISIECV